MDINWAFLRDDVPEIACIKKVVSNQRFRCVLDLHEDWESQGYYLYEQYRLKSIGRSITDRVRGVCPVDSRNRIEGEDAVAGVIHPNMDVPKRRDGSGIPISLFRNEHTENMITSESPSSLELDIRVRAHLMAIEAALEQHVAAHQVDA